VIIAVILARKAEIIYKIKNPLLNNATQEITGIFLFAGDNQKILKRLE
jgi:hypothetical protein